MNDVTGGLYAITIILIILVLWFTGVFDIIRKLTGAQGSGADIGAGAGDAVGTAIVGTFKSIGDNIGKMLPTAKKMGEVCKTHADCDGWAPAVAGTLACCGDTKTCQMQYADYMGVGFCNFECQDRPAGKVGNCAKGFHWPRKINEECGLHTDCENIDGQTPLGCQDSKCTQLKKDWVGVWYLPKDCVGKPFGAPGTCY